MLIKTILDNLEYFQKACLLSEFSRFRDILENWIRNGMMFLTFRWF